MTSNDKLVRIYLNDHMAGAVAGEELARRSLKNNKGNAFGDFLEVLLDEIRDDRRALADLMDREGVVRNVAKTAMGWFAEKAGRVKMNGRLRGYSDLSRLLELEGLALGIAGKRAGWLSMMERLGDVSAGRFTLGELVERASSQLERVEMHRRDAARIALGSGRAGEPNAASGTP